MSRLPKLLAAGALIAGSGTVTVLANPAGAGGEGPEPAVLVATAVFECTDDAITANWTLTVEALETQSVEILNAVAFDVEQDVDFTPDNELENGDTSTGSSTHPPDSTNVTLDVEYDTFTDGDSTVEGELGVEMAIVCGEEEPPPPPVEEPPAAEPTVAQPTVTG